MEGCKLSFREATSQEAEGGTLGIITGRAIVFNKESRILEEGGQRFREIIEPEAVTQAWLNTQDIKINLLHQRDLTIGRCKAGKGTNCKLWVNRDGVYFELAVPNCDIGRRAWELTRSGVYSGCSFEFLPDIYTIQDRAGDLPLVRHKKFLAIHALTIGMDPAYTQTTLSAREPAGQNKRSYYPGREREKEKSDSAQKARERDLEILSAILA